MNYVDNLSLSTLNPDKIQSNVSVQRQLILFVFGVHFSCQLGSRMFPPESSSQFLTHTVRWDLLHSRMNHEMNLQFIFENGEILTCQAWATENQVDLAVSANWSILSSCAVNGQRRKSLENRMVTDIVQQQTGNVLYRHFMYSTQQLQLFPHSPSLDKWRGTRRATFSFF